MDRPIIVFLGPSLPVEEARSILDAWYLPPAQAGDIFVALRLRPRAIGLVDGLFARVASVWHKELLCAMEGGVRVVGASSMGALRAAELGPFGMEGVGKVYRRYREGEYRDDDEVALLHADQSLGFRPLTEPLVNIRATLDRAVREGVLAPRRAGRLLEISRSLPYPERRWAAIARGRDLDGFRRFLSQGGGVDQKAADARALLRSLARGRAGVPPRVRARRTLYVRYLHHESAATPFRVDRDWLPPQEKRARLASRRPFFPLLRLLTRLLNLLEGPIRARRWEEKQAEAILQLIEPKAMEAAPPRLRQRLVRTWATVDRQIRRDGVEPPQEDFQEWADEFRRTRGLFRRQTMFAWLRKHRLTVARWVDLLASHYRIRFLLKNPPSSRPAPAVTLADVIGQLDLEIGEPGASGEVARERS